MLHLDSPSMADILFLFNYHPPGNATHRMNQRPGSETQDMLARTLSASFKSERTCNHCTPVLETGFAASANISLLKTLSLPCLVERGIVLPIPEVLCLSGHGFWHCETERQLLSTHSFIERIFE